MGFAGSTSTPATLAPDDDSRTAERGEGLRLCEEVSSSASHRDVQGRLADDVVGCGLPGVELISVVALRLEGSVFPLPDDPVDDASRVIELAAGSEGDDVAVLVS